MKALLPAYCRLMGYAILLLSIFAPFVLVIYGWITNENLALFKEVTKLFMMLGLLMALLAHTKNENEETAVIRIRAMRTAFFLTILYVFINMLYRLYVGDKDLADTSSFLIFMAIHVICLEFGLKKAAVDRLFKR